MSRPAITVSADLADGDRQLIATDSDIQGLVAAAIFTPK